MSHQQSLPDPNKPYWEEHKHHGDKAHGVKKVWYAPNQFEAYGEEEIQAVVKCLRSGWLAPGPETAEFENSVSKFFGKKHGVMVNSGSSANLIALTVAGLTHGDEVITCALTFSTTISVIVQTGAVPVFVDCAHARYVPSEESVIAAITPKTKAIFLANLVGSKVDWQKIRDAINAKPEWKHILLIEDSCDTITHTPSTDIAITSFYASHIITAGGGGGMVMFNSEDYKKKSLMFRDWGRIGSNTEDMSERFAFDVDGIPYDFKFLYGVVGYNFKSVEMCAAFGNCQFRKIDKVRQLRADNIARYCERLKGTSYVLPIDQEKYEWLAMPLYHKARKECLNFLEQHDVQTRVCFAGNVTRHPAFRQFLKPFPEADRVMAEGFLLGAHHGLDTKDVDRVCDLLIQFDKDWQAKHGAK